MAALAIAFPPGTHLRISLSVAFLPFAEKHPGWPMLAGRGDAADVLGIGQQLRGADFMSHTLWTAGCAGWWPC